MINAFCICIKENSIVNSNVRKSAFCQDRERGVVTPLPHVIYSRDFRRVLSRPLSVLTSRRQSSTINILNFESNLFLVIHLSVERRQV